jgi:hypothetical protein
MQSFRLVLAALAVLGFCSLALRHASPDSAHVRREVTRLRAHFDSVDGELRARNLREMADAQRGSRATLIAWLREYRDAGRFPLNDRFATATPIFRDAQGTLCAMGYLIHRSGREDLVDRVAATRNTAYLPKLAEDPDLAAWLDSVGLSVAEAARIQPLYDPNHDDDEVSAGWAMTSVILSGTSLASLGLNFIHPTKASAWTGVVAGTAAVIAGMLYLSGNKESQIDGGDGRPDGIGAANMLIGGGALAVGLVRLSKPPGEKASNARVAIAPAVIPAGARPRVGLTVNARF